MANPVYMLALTGGVLGGFGHCIGMCGPIVASYTLGRQDSNLKTAFVPQLLYNAGRVTTYTAAGAFMGTASDLVGFATKAEGLQNAVMVVAGMLMLFMGVGIVAMRSASFIEKHNIFILRMATSLAASPSIMKFYPMGLVLGLLPCGLSYTHLIAAAGTGNAASGALVMLIFGAGTLPAMLGFGALVSVIGRKARGTIYRLGGLSVTAMGIYFIYKGLSLHAQM